jgi:hypothetical protein
MWNANNATSSTSTRPIQTICEVVADGSVIGLVGGAYDGNTTLMLQDGASESIGPLSGCAGVRYVQAQFPGSLLREWMLPTQCPSHGTTCKLLAEICRLVEVFVGLPARPV